VLRDGGGSGILFLSAQPRADFMKGLQMETMKQDCAARIASELDSLNEQLNTMMDNPNHDDYFDEPALSIDTYKMTKVCFSYGGPSSYLEIMTDSDNDIVSVVFRFSDWFDTATKTVEKGSPAYTYAQNLIEKMEG